MSEIETPSGVPPVTEPSPGTGSDPGPVAAARVWPARILALTEVLLCSGVPTQLVIQLAAVTSGIKPWQAPGVPTLTFLVVTQLADAVLLIALMTGLLRLHGERPRTIWWGGRPPLRELGLGAALIPPVFALVAVTVTLASRFAPWLHNVPDNPFESLIDTPGRAALMALVVIVAGGIREELQRAFLLHHFERHLGGATAGALILSVAFGAGHYVQGWDAMLATGVIGAFWAVVYLRRRSIIAPMVSHAGFDVIQVVGAALTRG